MATLGELTLISSQKCFGGFQKIFSHKSSVLNCTMRFGIFLPKETEESKVPVLYYLSGLTCTEKNFIEKAGSQRCASKHGIAVVTPDTSPRGCNIPGEDDSYDFGTGAGFYVDSTQDPWKSHYQMHSYVTKELPSLILQNFSIDKERQGIFGHSMGGHGALICALKNPGLFKSVSAFSPICNPIESPWGIKALSGYLGKDKTAWSAWDASELAQSYSGPRLSILISTGDDDEFLKAGQLKPEVLIKKGATNPSLELIHKLEPGYDHSYYFIATFIEEHFEHHSHFLKK